MHDNRRKTEAFSGNLHDRCQRKSARMLDDCVRALDAAFEEHKAEAERRAAMQEEAQKEKLEREKIKSFPSDSWI